MEIPVDLRAQADHCLVIWKIKCKFETETRSYVVSFILFAYFMHNVKVEWDRVISPWFYFIKLLVYKSLHFSFAFHSKNFRSFAVV